MRFRFLHMADVHLGYRQYGLADRANDFARAFLAAIDAAIEHKVDFVLLAGDLFHKRAIDAMTLNQALAGLDRLQNAGIPCIAVEGNHELAHYDETLGWLHFLALRQSLILLRADYAEGTIGIGPYENQRGSWHDVAPGVRVHGIRYHGAGMRAVIDLYADALQANPSDGVEYSILVAHSGVDGVLAGDVSSPTLGQWTAIRPWIDYLALGHIHKPFDFQDWIYNPGSLEAVAVDESDWTDRGYWLVDVDTSLPRPLRHKARLCTVPRRPIVRAALKVDLMRSHEEILEECESLLRKRLGDEPNGTLERRAPIVDLLLTGTLPFDPQTLVVREIEERAAAVTDALHTIVRNLTLSGLRVVPPNGGLSRAELERQVMSSHFAADARYRERSESWADATVALKTLALSGASVDDVLDELPHLVDKARHNSAAPQPGA